MNWKYITNGGKFVLAAATLISTTALTWFDQIDGGVYSVVVIAVVGAYIAGNIIERNGEGKP
jgi:hypothetical protein